MNRQSYTSCSHTRALFHCLRKTIFADLISHSLIHILCKTCQDKNTDLDKTRNSALDATVSKVLLALSILYEFCRCFHRSSLMSIDSFCRYIKTKCYRHSNTIDAYWYFFSIERYHRNNTIPYLFFKTNILEFANQI